MRAIHLMVASIGILGSACVEASASPLVAGSYTIVPVPSLVSGGTSAAFGINDDGVVTGSAQTASGPTHAILWTPAHCREISGRCRTEPQA
jgi:probable HAF family extracellular repeat protein